MNRFKMLITETVVSSDTDPFELLKNIEITDDANVLPLFQSVAGLLMMIGSSGAILSLMGYMVVVLLDHTKKLKDIKEGLGTKLLACVGLFTFTFLCGVVKQIVDSFIG